jgi:hypothetical protein
MRSDRKLSVFTRNADEDMCNEWPTRDNVFSGDESMDESGWKPLKLADEWEYAEADDEWTNEASSERAAADWQCVGIAQVGGAVGLAAGIYCFDFRSQSADFRGTYLFIGGGLGLGGSLGGGMAPSPGDFIHNTPPDVWTSLQVQRPFSGSELDLAYASISSLGAAGAYGYTLMSITAGWADPLFTTQNVSGWGTGVGVSGAMLIGVWKMIGYEHPYY